MKIGKCISGNVIVIWNTHEKEIFFSHTNDKVSTTSYTEYQKANDVILSLPII